MRRLKFLRTLPVLLWLAMLASCSQGTSQVKLVVSQNFQFGSAALSTFAAGGLMVWGKSSDGSVFGQSLIDTDSITVPLNPGSWTFYAMAWDGSKEYSGSPAASGPVPFGGVHYCAISPVTSITKDAVNVQLTLGTTNCNNPVFAGSIGYVAEVPKFQPVFCQSIVDISTSNDLCGDTTSDSNVKAGRGVVGSFRVNLMSFTGNGLARMIAKPGVTGKCVPYAGTNASGSESSSWYGVTDPYKSVPGLPAGEAGSPFHVELEIFGSNDCDATPTSARGVIKRTMPEGIARSGFRSKALPYIVLNYSYRNYISLPMEDICNGRQAVYTDDHSFAWGNGSQNSPYVICSVDQFHKINSAATNMSSNFKLGSNLDFNPYSRGIASSPIPGEFNCLEIGSNFMPIGYVGASCAGPGNPMSWGTYSNFTGNFDGGGYTLKNLRLRAEDKDHIGLFANFQGFKIQNIKLENASISGKSYVGALAGEVAVSSSESYIANITSVGSDIEARDSSTPSKVGGIAGYSVGMKFKNILIKNQKVRGENNYVGGVAGSINNSLLLGFTNVSVESDIEANSPASITYVGGLIGLSVNVDLDYVKHEGGILTNAIKVGGIVGSGDSGTNLKNFYSISFVQTSQSSPAIYIGGVVGDWNSTGTVGPGYSLSQLKTGCTSSCLTGRVAGSTSLAPGTVNPIKVLSTTEAGSPVFNTFANTTDFASLSDARPLGVWSGFNTAGTSDWSMLSYQYPRFDFEKHPCQDPAFVASGDGTLLNPKKICHEGNYLALNAADSTTGAGKYHQLASNIRLSNNNTLAHEFTNFNVTLLGNNKSLIGGFSNSSGQTNTGHIRNLNGIIANLKIQGMARASNTSDRLAPHGVFVANNYGTLQNIQSWTTGQWPTFNYGHGSLFVGHNRTTGKISNVKVDGVMEAGDYDGIITVRNSGLIEDSKASGEFRCKEGAGCTYLAPLAIDNLALGRIKRTVVESRIEQGFGPVTSASMMVIDNAGDIQDIEVSEHSRFTIADGAQGKLFHFTNTGTLTRVMQNGEMVVDGSNQGFNITDFPSPSDALSIPDHVNVLRTGRSGTRMISEAPFTVSADGQYLEVDLSSLTTWNSYYGVSPYDNNLEKIMVYVDFDGPGQSTGLVEVYDFANNRIKIQGKSFVSGLIGKLSLYFTNDPGYIVGAGNSKNSGFIPLEDLETKDLIPWQADIYDPSKADDMSALLNYYKYFTGVTKTSITPRTWSMEDGQLRLFRVND